MTPTSQPQPRPGLHADRTARRHRHHRRPDRPAAARRAGGPRGGPAGAVRQQPEADRPGDAQLPPASTTASRRAALPLVNATRRCGRINGGFSAARRLLPNLEQQALYNAANFWIAVKSDRLGTPINSSRSSTRGRPRSSARRPPTRAGTAPSSNYEPSGHREQLLRLVRVGPRVARRPDRPGARPTAMFQVHGRRSRSRDVDRRHEQHDRLRRVEDRHRQRRRHTIPTDIVFLGSLPSGASRTTGDGNDAGLEHPGLPSLARQVQQAAKTAAVPEFHVDPWRDLGARPRRVFDGDDPAPAEPEVRELQRGGVEHPGRPGMFNMSSFHAGGANALFSDGSVKFIKDSTSQNVFWAIGSRNQGEVVSSDSF